MMALMAELSTVTEAGPESSHNRMQRSRPIRRAAEARCSLLEANDLKS